MISLHLASKILPLKASLRLLSMISHLNSSLKKVRHQCLASVWKSASKPSFVSYNNPCLANLKSAIFVLFAICQNCFCSLSALKFLDQFAYMCARHILCSACGINSANAGISPFYLSLMNAHPPPSVISRSAIKCFRNQDQISLFSIFTAAQAIGNI